ncbi:MAG: ComEC/Rec2 family competence protein [bacterium]|nr:ComEC/Rec2 family competence protein [bacterium]
MDKILNRFKFGFLLTLAAVTVLVWVAIFQLEPSRDKLVLDVFDIGQGDSIFIQSDSGSQVLIDGGPDSKVLAKLGEVMPFWDRSIDLVILTHPHADHVTGLIEVLKRYDVGVVMESGANYPTPEYTEWHRLLEQKHIPVIIAKTGQHIRLSPRAALDILLPSHSFIGASPKNVHDAMIVSRLTYGSTTVLLTGDAERPLEYQLIGSGTDLHADILKVGHHGSKTSTTEDFVRAVSPRFAVISVGRKNRYGHPAQQTLDTLAKFGIQTFRTDQDGDVKFMSNGRGLQKISE